MKFSILYVASIVLANIGFTVIPLVPIIGGEMWPPMSLLVGLIFVLRDFSQKEIGHRVLIAMLAGAVVSYFMASPFVAVASVCAFLISETVDWAFYSFSRMSVRDRVLLSSAFSTPVDSSVFLLMIGHFSVVALVAMTISKMVGALVVWKYMDAKS